MTKINVLLSFLDQQRITFEESTTRLKVQFNHLIEKQDSTSSERTDQLVEKLANKDIEDKRAHKFLLGIGAGIAL